MRDKRVIIGNWKSQMNTQAIDEWFRIVSSIANEEIHKRHLSFEYTEVVICVPFPYLSQIHGLARTLPFPLHVGAQDISPYGPGAYTGAVAGYMIAQFASFVLIGHSERRSLFGEDESVLEEKVLQAKAAGITPVYCVSEETAPIPEEVSIVAYEPVWAIGTGKPDTPENAQNTAHALRERNTHVTHVLYGGSVTGENADEFLAQEDIRGVLVGKASLDPSLFWEIIVHAVE